MKFTLCTGLLLGAALTAYSVRDELKTHQTTPSVASRARRLGGASDAVKTHNEAEQRGDLQAKLRALRVDGKADTQDGGLRSSVALDVSGVLEVRTRTLHSNHHCRRVCVL